MYLILVMIISQQETKQNIYHQHDSCLYAYLYPSCLRKIYYGMNDHSVRRSITTYTVNISSVA